MSVKKYLDSDLVIHNCGENANNFALEVIEFSKIKQSKLKKLVGIRYEKNLSD